MSSDESLVIDKEARIVSFIVDIDHETFESALDRAYQKKKEILMSKVFAKVKHREK